MFIVIQSQPCHDILFSKLSPKREVANHEGKSDEDQWQTSRLIKRSAPFIQIKSLFLVTFSYAFLFQTFPANVDRYSIKTNALPYPIYGRYVRLQIRGWYSRIAIRIELYGCTWSKWIDVMKQNIFFFKYYWSKIENVCEPRTDMNSIMRLSLVPRVTFDLDRQLLQPEWK